MVPRPGRCEEGGVSLTLALSQGEMLRPYGLAHTYPSQERGFRG